MPPAVEPTELHSAALMLRRATPAELPGIVDLQRAAYARNRVLLGVEPLPLQADYAAILRDMEVWLATTDGTLAGVLILEPETDHLLIWSIATDPSRQTAGLGRAMLAAAEVRAHQLGLGMMRLYTGSVLRHLVEWYGRHGYRIERIEQLPDRQIAHMCKPLVSRTSPLRE